MFQVTFLPVHGISVVHPAETVISGDLLFETDLLFAWGELNDPKVVKKWLGRSVPFCWGVINDYALEINTRKDPPDLSLRAQSGRSVQGAVLIGLTESEFEILDWIQQVPIHRHRGKVTCRIGNLERVVHIYLQQGALLAD